MKLIQQLLQELHQTHFSWTCTDILLHLTLRHLTLLHLMLRRWTLLLQSRLACS